MQKMDRLHITGMTMVELVDWLATHNLPRFRAQQIFAWIHRHKIRTFAGMRNLPSTLINLLIAEFGKPLPLECVAERKSSDGTVKYLFDLVDHNTIETVYIPEAGRGTLCISAQVGCAMNCSFCATGQAGYIRNLAAEEIVAQVLWIGHDVTNIVFMGMGEPFHNYQQVQKAITLLGHTEGLNIGMRRITISSCGLVPEIYKFADENTQVNLAISLHAPNNKKRTQIMPINKRYPIEELLTACHYYVQKTKRRISFEYALVRGFNDSDDDAKELSRLLADLLCHCNIIPVNPSPGYDRPGNDIINNFVKILNQNGVPVSIRKERGSDIEAACGQLRQQIRRGD